MPLRSSLFRWPSIVMVLLVWGRGRFAEAHDPPDQAPESIYEVGAIRDGGIIGASFLTTGLAYLFGSSLLRPKCPCRIDSVNRLDRHVVGNSSAAADWASTITVGLALVLPPTADFFIVKRRLVFLEDITVFAEAVSLNSAVVTIVKYSVQRPIPQVYSNPSIASDRANYRSFYSGHTSTVFAALTSASVTLDVRYGLTWEPWLASVAIGGSVAVERVLAGKHFYTDVLAGAVAGSVVGTLVASAHLRGSNVCLFPMAPAAGAGGVVMATGAF